MAIPIKDCKCKVKHYLHPHSTLEFFLRPGLIKQSLLSPDSHYTLNHILIALITIIKDKALLKFDHEEDQFYVNTDKSLQSLLGVTSWFYLFNLRRLIDIRFFNNSENLSEFDPEIFICPEQNDMKVIFELFNYEYYNHLQMYFNYNCQKEIMDEFPYIGMGLRLKTDFDFGNNFSRPIRYLPCDCKGRYPFKKTSLLLPYLQTAHGISSPDNLYTINYILMVLIADFKEKNLIQYDHKNRVHAFIVNPETSKILGITNGIFRNDTISLLHIRALIANAHLEGHRHVFNITQPPFSCTKSLTYQDIKLIHNLLNVPLKDPTFSAVSRTSWGGILIGHYFMLHM